jgi:hypothetical protein
MVEGVWPVKGGGAPLFSTKKKENIDILAIYGHSEAQKVPKCSKIV